MDRITENLDIYRKCLAELHGEIAQINQAREARVAQINATLGAIQALESIQAEPDPGAPESEEAV